MASCLKNFRKKIHFFGDDVDPDIKYDQYKILVC